MKLIAKALALLLLLPVFGPSAQAQVGTSSSYDQADSAQRQNLKALQKVAEQFVRVQSSGIAGTGSINVIIEPLDSRLNLAACPAPQAFLPNGGRLWGKTSIGVKCTAPSPWTIYMRATVQVISQYIVVAAPLAQGQTISPNNIAKVTGDLSSLPAGILTDESQALGRIANISLMTGAPLRQDALRTNRVVQQGQTVRVVSTGQGFQITTEGRALNNAGEGEMAQVKTLTGQVVSGIAKSGGIVEINY